MLIKRNGITHESLLQQVFGCYRPIPIRGKLSCAEWKIDIVSGMINAVLFFKLIASPFFTALVSFAQKRWSHTLAGAVSGLPLTAGPISLFLAIEQGLPFARDAASMSLAGLFATSAYAIVFILLSRKWSWPVCLLGGLAAWALCVCLLALVALPFAARIACAFLAVLANALFVLNFPDVQSPRSKALPWDTPVRAVTVLVPLLIVTGVARAIGPIYSGLLGSFPAMWSVLFSFTLAQAGRDSVINFFKGAAFLFGFPVFFCAIVFVPTNNIGLLYLIASVVALVSSYLMYTVRPKIFRFVAFSSARLLRSRTPRK